MNSQINRLASLCRSCIKKLHPHLIYQKHTTRPENAKLFMFTHVPKTQITLFHLHKDVAKM